MGVVVRWALSLELIPAFFPAEAAMWHKGEDTKVDWNSWSGFFRSFSVHSFRIVFIFDRAQRISLFGRSEM